MGTQLQLLILTSCIVNFGRTHDHQHNPSTAINNVEINENIRNLFESITQNDAEKSEIYREILNGEVAKERQGFDAMKEELRMARNRKSFKKRIFSTKINPHENVAVKRETKDEDEDEPSHTGPTRNFMGMVRDLTNLQLDSFVGLLSASLSQPLCNATAATYVDALTECMKFGQVGDQIMPASPDGTNLLFTTYHRYYIIQFTVNKTAEKALARMDDYKRKYFNDGKEVLCLGINYRYIGSARVSLQDRIICSWAAKYFSENGTLMRSIATQEDVYKRFAVETDHRDDFQKFKRQPISVYYDVLELLGQGEYSAVYHCRQKGTGKEFAAKFNYIQHPSHVSKEKIFMEADIIRQLNHPNLLHMYDAFETDTEIIMIVDYMKGGSLGDMRMAVGRNITEPEVVNLVRQITEGIKHLHDLFLVHFDLHPGNIMCETEACTDVKIIDFGKSGRLDTISLENEMMHLVRYNHSAPEVLEGKLIGFYTDAWSLGMITYFLISGTYPFITEHDTEVPKDVDTSTLFRESTFRNISSEGKDFIRRLLVVDRKKRMTIHECVNHAWLTGIGSSKNPS